MAPTLTTEQDFRRASEPFRRELQGHCYRMLGSIHDAEELTQETLARAWSRRDSFEGRSSLRTWLYKIATHACLDALEKRPARALPAEVAPASSGDEPPGGPTPEPIWLTPAPDAVALSGSPGPEARYTAKESVALAFLTALQLLPPKQRAVLLIRDVLGWSADDAAELFELTVPAVNSALQRARATLEQERPVEGNVRAPEDEATKSLLARYIRAWEDADLTGLVALLREDASFSMPPMPAWYRGRESIRTFLSRSLWTGDAKGRFRMVPISANGGPATAIYQRDANGKYGALGIQVVRVDGGVVREIVTFIDPGLFVRFELPALL